MTTLASPTRTAPAPAALPGRRLAVVGLAVGAALNTTEAVLAQFLPERPDSIAEELRLVAEHSTLYGARAVIGTLAVPFMLVGFLAAARLLAARARRTGWTAGSLLAVGMWGFAGVHVLALLSLPLATGGVPGAAAVAEELQSSAPLGALTYLPFLAGTVLGMLVLCVGLLRTGAVARWIPATWLVFLALDFTIGAVGPVDPHWLFLAGALGLAREIARGTAPRA
ncbi:hypothetical protein GB931_15695 [Modestobacter sp. I12A-02628]|uniref:DUF4386 domain-containing protein n=1 Tax=Goekera deserti TaxID=2497753 RepID=A0A7K3WJ75_9ACTN|nr:hypothetical protein [Goekera deserti]MPQ99334.1 hypothetical protein [Goekera deserti]NDI50333.1 hypothetical protein [Goekera deserti]NEL56416.1 hypothetical protein [Goekera deserti]